MMAAKPGVNPSDPLKIPDSLESTDLIRKKLGEYALELEKQRYDLKTIYYIADQLSRSIQPKLLSRRVVELTKSVFGSVCILISGHFNPETNVFSGTVTYPEPAGTIVENPFPDKKVNAVPFYRSTLVNKWMRGELDGVLRFREGHTVAYPLERHGRRLGLILAPSTDRQTSKESSYTRMNPEIVQAARQHLAVALELSELQREQLQQERLAAVGQTVAGLSHYMKNVLNGLKGGEYVIARAIENENPEKLQKGLSVLRSSIGHIEKLTYDMLYYTGDRALDLKPVNPNEIMQEAHDSLEEFAARKGITFRTQLDEHMVAIPADRHALYRSVLNLATNAIDACLETEGDNTIVLKSALKTGYVLLTVEDNGIGISPEVMRRVGEKFFTTKSSSGTGLGLPVTRKIVEKHGGILEIESVFGKGSSFHIRLPRA